MLSNVPEADLMAELRRRRLITRIKNVGDRAHAIQQQWALVIDKTYHTNYNNLSEQELQKLAEELSELTGESV